MDKNTQVNVYNNVGQTPLTYAACYSKCALLPMLLVMRDKDLEKEKCEKFLPRQTALHIAAEHYNPKGVDWLLSYGVFVDPIDDLKNTPLHYAILNSVKSMQSLIDVGADVNKQSVQGSPLHVLAFYAGLKEDLYAVRKAEILLAAGADINALYGSSTGYKVSPLQILERRFYKSIAYDLERFLIQKGAKNIAK